MRLEAFALRAGVAVPLLYFGSVFLASLFYPGYNFVRQYASELGAEGAPHPYVLNVGLILVGFTAVAAAYGFRRVLRRLGARAVPARWTWCIIALFGVAMGFAGSYAHPDWRHSGFGLSFFLLGGPATLAAALRGRPEARSFNRYLVSTNILMVVMVAVMFGTGRTRVSGLCQLLYTLAAIPWIGVSACVLSRIVSRSLPATEAS